MTKVNNKVLVVGFLTSYAISIYCFLWSMSSFSLSFTTCSGTHSLFHAIPRCRWASVAAYGFWGFGILGLLLLTVFIYRKRKAKNKL